MELLSPGTGLIIWQSFALLGVLLFIVSWIVILRSNEMDSTKKFIWLLGTLFLPAIGPVLFFISRSSFKGK